jgi:hypothetical protein
MKPHKDGTANVVARGRRPDVEIEAVLGERRLL